MDAISGASKSSDGILPVSGEDMARRRFQAKGNLYHRRRNIDPPGKWWYLRWREDATRINDAGKEERYRAWSRPVVVGPGPGNTSMKPLTKREAKREAWDRFLSKLDQNNFTPRSVATVADFVRRKFEPDHIRLLKKNTRIMYGHLLKNHVLPRLGTLRLRDVGRDDVQSLVSDVIASGRSVQTACHIRNVVSAIFRMAEDLEWSQGNPARRIRLPEMTRKYRGALTWSQVQQIAGMLEELYGAMVLILAATGMRIGELCGLRWKWVNLADHPVVVDAETIPEYTIAVREQFTAGEWQTLKKKKSYREIPMTATAWVELATRHEKAADPAPAALVFANRAGKPLDAHNLANRHFKPVAVKMGLPWASLHCLRHTRATMADRAEITMKERMDLLGHADPKTTMRYTHADLARIRAKLDAAETAANKEVVN